MSIDGRHKNIVFYFPSLQTPRRMRRGQSSPGKDAGQLSRRIGGSNGEIRSHSSEGARIVMIGVVVGVADAILFIAAVVGRGDGVAALPAGRGNGRG